MSIEFNIMFDVDVHRDDMIDHGRAVLTTAAKTIDIMGRTSTHDDTIDTI